MGGPTLEDLLASIRGGKLHATRRLSAPLPPILYYNFEVRDLCEDDWETEDNDKVICIAPKLLASQRSSLTDELQIQDVWKRQIDQAIALKRMALEYEKQRNCSKAIEYYTEAGLAFLHAGRGMSPGATQKSTKMEAFAILKRAETLAKCEGSGSTSSFDHTTIEMDRWQVMQIPTERKFIQYPHAKHGSNHSTQRT